MFAFSPSSHRVFVPSILLSLVFEQFHPVPGFVVHRFVVLRVVSCSCSIHCELTCVLSQCYHLFRYIYIRLWQLRTIPSLFLIFKRSLDSNCCWWCQILSYKCGKLVNLFRICVRWGKWTFWKIITRVWVHETGSFEMYLINDVIIITVEDLDRALKQILLVTDF